MGKAFSSMSLKVNTKKKHLNRFDCLFMLSVSKIIPRVKRKGQGREAKAARRTDVFSAPRDAMEIFSIEDHQSVLL